MTKLLKAGAVVSSMVLAGGYVLISAGVISPAAFGAARHGGSSSVKASHVDEDQRATLLPGSKGDVVKLDAPKAVTLMPGSKTWYANIPNAYEVEGLFETKETPSLEEMEAAAKEVKRLEEKLTALRADLKRKEAQSKSADLPDRALLSGSKSKMISLPDPAKMNDKPKSIPLHGTIPSVKETTPATEQTETKKENAKMLFSGSKSGRVNVPVETIIPQQQSK